MQELEKKLNYTFRNQELLREALNHSSYANEHRSQGLGSNERLEFLGDSVLGVTVADFLYRRFPDMPEGRMTRLRAELVCEQSLHRVALELHLGEYLRLGKGEEHNGGRALQELVQRQSGQVLSYELVGEEGPDHAKTFRMQVCLNGEPVGLGTGRTKKEAEQTAAASALEALRK